MTDTATPGFRSPLRLAQYAAKNGSHFFSPGAMEFFDSRVSPTYLRKLDDGKRYLLIVSNQFHDRGESAPREYAVVIVEPSGVTKADYAADDRFPNERHARVFADRLAVKLNEQ